MDYYRACSTTACFSPNRSKESTDKQKIFVQEWELLIEGRQYGIYVSETVLVKTQDEFDGFWKQSQSGNDF